MPRPPLSPSRNFLLGLQRFRIIHSRMGRAHFFDYLNRDFQFELHQTNLWMSTVICVYVGLNAVWPDASADLCGAGTEQVALRLRLQNLWPREEGSEQCSEKSITQQQAGLVRRQKRVDEPPRSRWGPDLVANSLCRGQEKRTMH